MSIILKVIITIVAFFITAVVLALAFGAPTPAHKNQKVEEIKQYVIWIGLLILEGYLIWFVDY